MNDDDLLHALGALAREDLSETASRSTHAAMSDSRWLPVASRAREIIEPPSAKVGASILGALPVPSEGASAPKASSSVANACCSDPLAAGICHVPPSPAGARASLDRTGGVLALAMMAALLYLIRSEPDPRQSHTLRSRR